MSRMVVAAMMVVVLLAGSATAQVPPGYEIVTIDPDPTFNYYPRMNNRTQVVCGVWLDEGNTDAIEIFLYDNGQITRLTDDNVFDRTPDINDAGQIVWSRAVDGAGTPTQIVLWEDGDLRELTFSEQDDRSPRINNLGHVVWKRYMGDGCGGQRMDIFLYDGEAIRRITTNGETDDLANQSAKINDRDQIVWTEYNFCVYPWTSRIMLWENGETTQLNPPDHEWPQTVSMNNHGWVTWSYYGVWLWRDGAPTLLTDWGTPNAINDRGEIAIGRSYDGDPVPSSEVWLYRNGQFHQITDDPHDQGWENVWNTASDINELGEIVFNRARPWYYEAWIKCMKLRLGSPGFGARVEAIEVKNVDP